MKQEEYRSCMSKNMGGGRLKGLSKEERRIEFCVIAKGCAKGMPTDEARRICSQPKAPKPAKVKKSKKGGKVSASSSEGSKCLANVKSRVASGELPANTDPLDVCAEILDGSEIEDGSGVFVKVGRKQVELPQDVYEQICPCAVGGE